MFLISDLHVIMVNRVLYYLQQELIYFMCYFISFSFFVYFLMQYYFLFSFSHNTETTDWCHPLEKAGTVLYLRVTGSLLTVFISVIQDLMGDSRKYPYHTMDGFHSFIPPCFGNFHFHVKPFRITGRNCKYAKFGLFYTKIFQMTLLLLFSSAL